MSGPLIKSACRDDGLRRVEYLTADGDRFVIDHRGWILTPDLTPISHPQVDDLMLAVIAWERS